MENTQQDSKNVISPQLILLNQELTNQDEIIQFIVQQAEKQGYVSDEQALYQAVKKREQEVSTAIGYSIAIPHGKTDAVSHPFIAFLRTTQPMKWTDENEELVRLVFLIGVPEKSEGKLHLKFISQLSKKLLDDAFRDRLLTEDNEQTIYEQLNSIEI
jgi:fructose-specific phosphotransferase system IIA component